LWKSWTGSQTERRQNAGTGEYNEFTFRNGYFEAGESHARLSFRKPTLAAE